MTIGFVTLATGKEEYYKLANNLLHSYRYHSINPLPFAIISESKNKYTRGFDDVIVMNSVFRSYLDKLNLYEYLPYDVNIFIDSDCLAYGDLNQLLDYFEGADDFSCFGRVLSLTDKTGWFEYEYLGELQNRISYVVGLHGGIYYIKKSKVSREVFETAKKILPDYKKFKFKGNFSSPGDEPLIALSMALNQCKPVPYSYRAITCYWEFENQIKLNIIKGRADNVKNGISTILVHWGTRFTQKLLYKKQISLLKIVLGKNQKNVPIRLKQCNRYYNHKIVLQKIQCFLKKIIDKEKIIFKI